LVDTLDYLPANHPSRATVLAILDKTARGIVKWQDPASGLWWQVLDQGARPGNYHEATAAAMFVYALAKAVNHGYLSRSYIPAIELGYAGLTRELVANDGPGQWSLIQCCSVAGLGFTTTGGRPRDGSFDYYINEPIVKNDLKGLGPFVLAGLELEKF
ncbi:MAG TPA: glycoside hydrolase family 88 protein, partial [Verrucomicrobiae bacterium]